MVTLPVSGGTESIFEMRKTYMIYCYQCYYYYLSLSYIIYWKEPHMRQS